MERLGWNVVFVMNITDIDDKIIVGARRDHLIKEFTKQHPSISQSLVSKATDAWAHYIKSCFSQYTHGLEGWEVFVAKVEGGEIQPLKSDQKFALHLKTSKAAKNAIANATIGIDSTTFLDSTRDVIALHLDSMHSHSVTDPAIFRKFAAKWEQEFFKDCELLNIKPPTVLTRVSEYVPEIIAYVEQIITNGYAYMDQGSVYFDSAKFHHTPGHCYAKLEPWSASNLELAAEGEGELADGAAKKRNPADFVLWKKSKSGEPFWDSPWGQVI